jgi:hypothetical protein
MFTRCTAHFCGGLQPGAESWTFRFAENITAIVFVQLLATYTGRFTLRHARQGRGDGGCDAAGTATRTTIHRYAL